MCPGGGLGLCLRPETPKSLSSETREGGVAETPCTKSRSVPLLSSGLTTCQPRRERDTKAGKGLSVSQVSSLGAGHARKASTRGHCALPCPSPMLLGELSPSHHLLILPLTSYPVCFCCLAGRVGCRRVHPQGQGPQDGGGT